MFAATEGCTAALAVTRPGRRGAIAGCGDDDDDDGGSGDSGGGGGGKIALLLPGVEDRALRVAGPPELREEGQGALHRLRDHLQQRRPGRRQAAAAGRGGADQGRQGAWCSTRSTRPRRRDRDQRAKQQDVPVISYDRLITDADIDYYISFDNEQVGKLQAETLVKKLEEDGTKNATITMINGAPDRQQRQAVQEGRDGRVQGRGRQDRQGVRHARLEPRQGPAGDGAGDHRARQGRLRRPSTPPTTAPPAAPSRR